MTKLWIRVDADSPDDPAINELADTLGIDPMQALGHCMAVWGVVAKHATSGSLANVSAVTIERWARWHGARGEFFTTFARLFVDETGNLSGWHQRQGKLIARAERDRKRHQRVTPPSAEPPPSPSGKSGDPPQSLRGVSAENRRESTSTVRNGTVRNRKSKATAHTPAADAASSGAEPEPTPSGQHAVGPPAPEGGGKYPHFPQDVCGRLHAVWVAERGVVDYGRFRRALAPLYARDGPMFTESQLKNAIEFCIMLAKRRQGYEWRSLTPEVFVGNVQENVRLGNMETVRDGDLTERGRMLHGGQAA